MTKKFAFLLGTRPEIIKMAPLIKEVVKHNINFFIIHTGQHYSEGMDKIFWENLELDGPEYRPKYNLQVGSGTHAEQVGKIMINLEKVLLEEKPDYIFLYGDLNGTVAGALVAAKLNIPIVHLEAGLRSFDRTMPEEINRVVTGCLASVHFVSTPLQVEFLRAESITKRVHVVGNLIVDIVGEMASRAKQHSTITQRLSLESGKFFLSTIHRPGCVDNLKNFQNVLTGLGAIATQYDIPVIYPIHPRSRKNLSVFALKIPTGIQLIEPIDYYDFLTLMQEACLILSDSGGIQEEACILHVPVVTLRENTERQETIELGSNILAGYEPESIVEKTGIMLSRPTDWQQPYGSNVAEKILDIMVKNY